MRTSKSVKHFKPYEAWNCMESLLTSESFASNWMLRQCFPTFRVAICQAIHACAGYLNDRSPWAWFHDVRCQGICVFSSRPPKKKHIPFPRGVDGPRDVGDVWSALAVLGVSPRVAHLMPAQHGCTDGVVVESRRGLPKMTEDRTTVVLWSRTSPDKETSSV